MGLLDALFQDSNYGGQGGGLLDLIRSTQAQNSQYQPGAGFGQPSPLDTAQWPAGPMGAPSAPATFAQRFDATPNAPQPFTPQSRPFDNASFDPSIYAPNQAQPIAVGSNYQMPRMGSADQFQPSQAMIPPNAQPTQGQLPPGVPPITPQPQAPQQSQQALPPAFGGNTFGGNIGASLQSFAGTPGGLINKLVGGTSALINGQRTDPQGMQQQNLAAQYQAVRQALIENGDSPQAASSKAMVAALNPEAAKTILPELFTNKTELKMVKDQLGGETPYSWNSREQTLTPVNPAGGAGGGPGGSRVLAEGVEKYNPNLSGEDYINQFSPEVKAAAKAYMNGDVMPTGNPRNQSIASFAKTVAQKYGSDIGVPVNDISYAAKRKMQTDLASSGNSTMGGILSNGESSFKHLAEYTASAADQGNMSLNFPTGGMIAHGLNYVGNQGGGSDTQGKVKAINDNLGKYGAESTKFYAGTGGGVEERLNALKEMNATTTSGEEAAAYAAKEKSLMLDRLNTKFQEIRNTLGEERGNAEIAKHMPDIQRNITTIDANIARMRGQSSPAAPQGGIPSGWSVKVH